MSGISRIIDSLRGSGRFYRDVTKIFQPFPLPSKTKDNDRVVTNYMGSGIKGLKRVGIREHSPGIGITTQGSGSTVFFTESGIRLS